MIRIKSILPLIFLLFFISGATGLVYEVVWTRMLVLIFGSTTTSIVAVLSAFMTGLALGSVVFGKISDFVKNRWQLYGLLELGIGLTSVVVPFIFGLIMSGYRDLYFQLSSAGILPLVKFILTFVTILPTTIFMGGTLPVMIRQFEYFYHGRVMEHAGKLYGVNTLGALVGTVIAALILIEVFGLRMTVTITSAMNILIGLTAIITSRMIVKDDRVETAVRGQVSTGSQLAPEAKLIMILFGLSGLLSMAYEVLWTRMLTPVSGTFVYSFALILSLYLLGIAVGSFLGEKWAKKSFRTSQNFGFVMFGIGLCAFLTVVIVNGFYPQQTFFTIVMVVLPATILMGMTFPIVSGLFKESKRIGTKIGLLYGLNTIGSVIGPIVAGFILIPALGTGRSIVFLAGTEMILGIVLVSRDGNKSLFMNRIRRGMILIVVGALGLSIFSTQEFFYPKPLASDLMKLKQSVVPYKYLEDNTASVLGYSLVSHGKKQEAGLVVDGQGMTALVDETKIMAHLPLALVEKPERMLVICFGMGTTFRSALTHDIFVDGVDLVPSVPLMFPLYFQDARVVMNNPKGKIIINDGRNYLFVSNEKYDVITVDPPPPVNAAGTTVLYSKEYYQQARRILKPGGIFQQWFYFGTKKDDFQFLISAFIQEFPYVEAFRSPANMGLFLLGSDKPINVNLEQMKNNLSSPKVVADMNEWNSFDAERLLALYYGNKVKLKQFVNGEPPVSDDRPRTEYFFLRRLWNRYNGNRAPMDPTMLPI